MKLHGGLLIFLASFLGAESDTSCNTESDKKILQLPVSPEYLLAVVGDTPEETEQLILEHDFEDPKHPEDGKMRFAQPCAKCFAQAIDCALNECQMDPTCECFLKNCGDEFEKCSGRRELPGLCPGLEATSHEEEQPEETSSHDYYGSSGAQFEIVSDDDETDIYDEVERGEEENELGAESVAEPVTNLKPETCDANSDTCDVVSSVA